MPTLTFPARGCPAVRFWFYEQDGVLAYNWATGRFDGKSRQTARWLVDPHGNVVVGIPATLPDGAYEFRVVPDTVTVEPAACSKVYFRISTAEDELKTCEVDGYAIPVGAPWPPGPKAATVPNSEAAAGPWPVTPTFEPKTAQPSAPAGPAAPQLTLTRDGRTRSVQDWARELGVHPAAIFARLAAGCTVEQALTKEAPAPAPPAGRAGRVIELD